MKAFTVSILCPLLISWSLIPKKDEFGTRTGKTGAVMSPLIQQTKFDVVVGLSGNVTAILIDKRIGTTTMLPYIYGETRVAVRHARGTFRFTAHGDGEGVIVFGQDHKTFLNILRRSRNVKIAVVDDDETYVFDLDCRGFRQVWRRARW